MAKLTKAQIHEIFEILARERPEPKTELNYTNPFTLLCAVAFSAQSTDVGVNKATRGLFEKYDTPQKMLELGEEGLGEYLKTVGLWRQKAKNAIAMSKILVEKFGGQIPKTREELTILPGIGRKTANVVLNEAFGEPTIAVDTHIFRVSNRTGLAKGKNPDEVEAGLEKIVPKEFKLGAHHWLILHGRYTCVARKPKCNMCPIVHLCQFREKIGGEFSL